MLPIFSRLISIYLSTARGSSLHSKISVSSVSNVSTKFILIDTKHPGNIGSAARAIKTMGFSKLVVVSPKDDRVLGRKKCIEGASGAVDVLREVQFFDNLADVFKDDDGKVIICGTGMPIDMRLERAAQNYVAPRKFFEELLLRNVENKISGDIEKEANIRIAFLFGNERYGMKTEDTDSCDVMLGIPTNPKFGSLNLATAVQIIAYDWRQALGGFDYEA